MPKKITSSFRCPENDPQRFTPGRSNAEKKKEISPIAIPKTNATTIQFSCDHDSEKLVMEKLMIKRQTFQGKKQRK